LKIESNGSAPLRGAPSLKEAKRMTENWKKAIAQVVKAINQKRRKWGIRINKWELTGRKLGVEVALRIFRVG
jgi:hypothetical protein